MFLGLDIGTSGVKALLVDADQNIVADATASLTVSRPKPLWSEQNPADWWRVSSEVVQRLSSENPNEMAHLEGIGLSGQMHGATLLDASGEILRPAILWNDGRSASQCVTLEAREPSSRSITGNLAMPGFTAPKLLWIAEHEPDTFARIDKVLLPKDYVRFRMTGEFATDMSDSAGTMWLDVAARDWSNEMLAATDLDRRHMPRLVEGNAVAGTVSPAVARQWGLPPGVIVAGGAGDNAAGAVGIGAVAPGNAFLSLGTSGVYFVTSETFAPNSESAVHTFCHCLPATWHQMSVILSAASCLSWVAELTGADNEEALLVEIETADDIGDVPVFLPYLSGERTPHNDPHAKGVFFGLTHETGRAALGRSVLEGVAFAFADGQDALLAAGAAIDRVSVIGGGAHSRYWGAILATVLDRPLTYHAGGETGPAFGAARLARLAVTGEDPTRLCAPPTVTDVVEPDCDQIDCLARRREKYRRLYAALKNEFAT